MLERLQEVERRYEELERLVADPAVIANRREFASLHRRHRPNQFGFGARGQIFDAAVVGPRHSVPKWRRRGPDRACARQRKRHGDGHRDDPHAVILARLVTTDRRDERAAATAANRGRDETRTSDPAAPR